MSWLQRLCATYDLCATKPEFTDPPQIEGKTETPALMPVSHINQQAHIHIVLDAEGNFLRAELLPPKMQVVIPATEDSAARTRNYVAHPLADKIHYCAKDYQGTKKNLFELYSAQLKKWCDSPHGHPKARAVYAYAFKGTIIQDLDREGIFVSGKVDGRTGRDQGDALVVWSVVIPGDKESRTWKDRNLQAAWTAYDTGQARDKSLCMVTGSEGPIIIKHPRYIRRPGDGAKLISSNDDKNFTFRGRFVTAEESSTVGYEISYKAHNALIWLLARQGYRNGEQAVLAWAMNGEEIPQPGENIPLPEDVSIEDIDFENTDGEIPGPSGNERTERRDMGQSFSLRLRQAMRGYRKKLEDTEGISILALEAASAGRLSMTFYRELMCGDYLTRLEQWQEDMAWALPVQGKKFEEPCVYSIPSAPTPERIARVAYGRRRNVKDHENSTIWTWEMKSPTLLKSTVERLLPCIVDGTPVPWTLVEICKRRAINRSGLNKWEWEDVLAIACALYKGFYARNKQGERRKYTMALDEERNTRDYLYGRLLAVSEYAERTALTISEENRPTNAERLMPRFADHPCATWRTLEIQLIPYMQRLQRSDKEYSQYAYKRVKALIEKISDMFDADEFSSPQPLKGEFLLGYHCQRSALYRKKNNPTSAEEKGEKA